MKPDMLKLVSPEDLDIFEKIKRVVCEMPEVELEKDERNEEALLSCHMLTRALAHFFPISYRDGYFGHYNSGHEHSWLLTNAALIIDPYPIGVLGGPILVETRYMTPLGYLYKEAELPQINSSCFFKNVARVTEVVGQTIVRLGIELSITK